MEFIKCNKAFEDMECTSFSFSIIDKLGKENVLEKKSALHNLYLYIQASVAVCNYIYIRQFCKA